MPKKATISPEKLRQLVERNRLESEALTRLIKALNAPSASNDKKSQKNQTNKLNKL
jgi:hypothetical protein